MKKTIIAAAIMLLATSCVVSNGTDKDKNFTNLETIVEDLTGMSTKYAVSTLWGLSESDVDINADGFRYQSMLELETRPDIKYVFEKTADFRWQVTAYGDLMNFTLTLSFEDDSEKWTVEPFTLDYDEGFGYSATLSAEENVTLHTGNRPVTNGIRQTGTYFLQVFIDGKEADSFRLDLFRRLVSPKEAASP